MIELLTFALVVITGFYAWVTFRMLKVTETTVSISQQQLRFLSRPYVVAKSTVRSNTMVYLELENTGQSAAQNVRFSLDKDFFQFGDKDKSLRSYNVFSETIDSIPPGHSLVFNLGIGHQIYSDKSDQNLCPLRFKVTAKYEYEGTTFEETMPIDLRMHLNSAVDADPVVDEIKKLSKAVESVSKSVKALK